MSRLFVRIFLWFWLGSTALVLVLAASLLVAQPEPWSTWRAIGRTAMGHLGAQAADAYEARGAQAAHAIVARAAEEGRFRVWLYAADGRFIAGPSPVERAAEVVDRALAGDSAERVARADSVLIARRATARSGARYVVMWEAPQLRAWPQRSPGRFALRLGALVLTGGAACWLLAWQITKPIRTLRSAARRFAGGDLSVRVAGSPELGHGDELAELAREFDQMAARIDGLIRAQQQLLADISHELRSPLARLSLALDLARRRIGDDVPEHQRIDREVRRMNELIEQLLTLARLQGHGAPLPETVDLREMVREIARDAAFEADASGKTVVVRTECEATVRGNRSLLRSAIENVVRNAVQYAPERTEVSIDMERRPGHGRAVILVRDRGDGVPPGALNRLFDPFFRVDEARDRVSGGIGLGLAITRQAILAHGGQVAADNHPEGGLIVRLELPAGPE